MGPLTEEGFACRCSGDLQVARSLPLWDVGGDLMVIDEVTRRDLNTCRDRALAVSWADLKLGPYGMTNARLAPNDGYFLNDHKVAATGCMPLIP